MNKQASGILVVDPSELSRKVLTKLLAKHNTVFAADGSDSAWELLDEHQPHCVVIDVEQNAEDTFALLELLRNSRSLRGLPVIVLGPGDEGTQERALSAGAGAYLEKPFDSKELLKLIEDPPPPSRTVEPTIDAPSTLDALTGLPQEDYFYYRGEKELAFAKRYNKKLAVLVFEVDRLEDLVEQHGAPLAKQVIKKLSKYIIDAVRGEDTVARLSGRSFGVLAPTCDEFGAKSIADRLVDKVRRRVFNYGSQRVSFSVSAGLAAPRISQCENFRQMADLARERLDSAVAAGGNQAVFDGPSHKQALSRTQEQRAVDDLVEEASDTTGMQTAVFRAVDPDMSVEQLLDDGVPSLDVVMWLLENGLGEELKPHYGELLGKVMPLLETAGASLGNDVQALVQKLRSSLK